MFTLRALRRGSAGKFSSVSFVVFVSLVLPSVANGAGISGGNRFSKRELATTRSGGGDDAICCAAPHSPNRWWVRSLPSTLLASPEPEPVFLLVTDGEEEAELIGCVMRCENHAFPFFVARPATFLLLILLKLTARWFFLPFDVDSAFHYAYCLAFASFSRRIFSICCISGAILIFHSYCSATRLSSLGTVATISENTYLKTSVSLKNLLRHW